jgi:hypothetical protein
VVDRQCSLVVVLVACWTIGASAAQGRGLVYNELTPCRVVDTRNPSQPLLPNVTRSFVFRGPTTNYGSQGGSVAGCGIPGLTTDGGLEQNAAKAVAVNLVAVGATGAGHLLAWPSNQPAPLASVLNYAAAAATQLNIANGVILPLCDEVASSPCAAGDISFLAGVSGTDLVVDVVGYFTTPGRPGATRFGTAGIDDGLCTGPAPANARFGLSAFAVSWEGAAAACPAGTWVCSLAERGTGVCNTARVDSGCDGLLCDGTCFDLPDTQHLGWVSNVGSGGSPLTGAAVLENGSVSNPSTCHTYPVWCCSR